MKRLFVLLLILSILPSIHATTGFEMLQVPEGSISKTKSVLEAKIENVGFDRIFVALPDGWVIDDANTYASSYAVIETGLWRKYGDPFDRFSLLGSGVVFKEKGLTTKLYENLSNRQGWYLRPNEGVVIHVSFNPITCSASIDPLAIEKTNPSIMVKKWVQEFTITPSATGFITAPCVVENSALTVANPGPISDVTQKPSAMYYREYQPFKEIEQAQLGQVPSWDAWFTLTGSLTSILSTKSIVGLEPTFNKTNVTIVNQTTTVVLTQTPVWTVEDFRDIVYQYEWERDKVIIGIQIIKGVTQAAATIVSVPEWFDWF